MGAELLVLIPIAILVVPFVIAIAIVSRITGTPMENGFRAIGWLLVVLIAASAVGSAVDPAIAWLATYVAGAVATYALARRDGYEFDRWSWALLALWFVGYWIVLWRRENDLWRRRASATANAR